MPVGEDFLHLSFFTVLTPPLRRHAKITDQHFYVSVLQSLPEKQSHLDDTPLFVPPMSMFALIKSVQTH